MSVEWKDQTVEDHRGGITDLVTSSDSSFQEACENLDLNDRLNLISSRAGYKHWTDALTPTKIQQLFKLEDWILALCYDDPTGPTAETDQVSGQLYYRLETDQVSPWTLVDTPKKRDTAVSFRIYQSSTGKGFTLLKTAPTVDQLVIKDGVYNTPLPPFEAPEVTVTGSTVFLTLDKEQLNAALKYTTLGGTILTYGDLQTIFNAVAGFTFTLLSGTLPTDEVVFDGVLSLQEKNAGGFYPANARSEGAGDPLHFINEQGHIQSSEWQSHLYTAFEPYIKTFKANDADPYGKDPDTFPPDNNRLPLRKIAPIASPEGVLPVTYAPKAFNAQLPKTFISTDETETELNVGYSATAKYQVFKVKFDYKNAPYLDEDTATFEIWSERTWGQVGSMSDQIRFSIERVTAAPPTGVTNPLMLVDPNWSGTAPYTGLPNITTWGQMILVWHEGNPVPPPAVTPNPTYAELAAFIQQAFSDYQNRVIGTPPKLQAYENFGFYIKQNPDARQDVEVDMGTGTTINVSIDRFFTDNLPEDIPGNHRYGYAFYLRDGYQGEFEGSPREFLFDGPAAFTQVRTLSPIGAAPLKAWETSAKNDADLELFSTSPTIYGGIAARVNRDTDLYYQSTLEGVFARTTDGGDVYYIDEKTKFWYRTSEFPLPPALIADSWTQKTAYVVPHESEKDDAALVFGEQAYFNGGVLSYDSIPQGPYYFWITNQVGYYGNIVNNIQRVYQSTPGIPHSSPGLLFSDFDDGITAEKSFLDKALVWTQNTTFRMEGVRGSDGVGRTFLRTVSDEFGCVSNQSVVLTNIGVFYWSNNGIIYTDGLRAFRISEHLIDRYNTWLRWVRKGTDVIGAKQLRGSYDEANRTVYWSLFDANGQPFFVTLSVENAVNAMMPIRTHIGYRHNEINLGAFTVTPIDYFLSHATLYSDDFMRFYRGQGRHLLYAEEKQTYDESDQNLSWQTPITVFFKSVAYSYGLPWSRKWTTKFNVNMRDLNHKGVSMTPLSWNDLSPEEQKLGNCLNYQHLPFSLDYNDSNPLTLDQFFQHLDCQWKSEHIVSYKRRFPKGRIRNIYKQVGFRSLKHQIIEYVEWEGTVVKTAVTYKAGFTPPVVVIDVNFSPPLASTPINRSGQFQVSWDGMKEPIAVSEVSLTDITPGIENQLRLICLSGEDSYTDPTDFTYYGNTIRIYRIFPDQSTDMIGYNLTYRLVGDRTHGMPKSTAQGGTNA